MTEIFLGVFFLPVGNPRFDNAVLESLRLVKGYAQEHVLLCLVPAFFIAAAISVICLADKKESDNENNTKKHL